MNRLLATAILLVASTLPASASEYYLTSRTMQAIVGNACKSLGEGEPLQVVRKEIEHDLHDQDLTPLQVRQASTVITNNVSKICGAKS